MSFDKEYVDPHGKCAAEIGRLRAINAELVAVLEAIVDMCGRGASHTWIKRAALAAIAKAKGEE